MPVLTVHGLNAKPFSTVAPMELVYTILPNAVASVEELNIDPTNVSVYVPTEAFIREKVSDVVIFIDALTEKPDRTDEVKQKLTDVVARAVWEVVKPICGDNWRLIEANIRKDGILTMITPADI